MLIRGELWDKSNELCSDVNMMSNYHLKLLIIMLLVKARPLYICSCQPPTHLPKR